MESAPSTPDVQDSPPRSLLSGGEGRRFAPLPQALTPLIGREREVATARELLRRPDVRLLTLTGPGGIGKTSLALEVARGAMPAFPDGVRFVPLAAVPDADLVATVVARALSVQETRGVSASDALMAALRDADVLLVLDTFEHVLAAASFVTDLLAACPRLTTLVTSRAPLRVPGEQVLSVPPLDLPVTDEPETLEILERSASVRLFVARAKAVDSTFALTETTAQSVSAICRRLDGLPLAIELAAAQSGVLRPAALLERIQARLPLPVAGPRNAPDRLRTMRDAVAWSYDLLPDEERTLFRRLGVFVGGFTLAAAERVIRGVEEPSGREDDSLLDTATSRRLDSLTDKSLVRRDDGAGAVRFSLLDTIRAFAVEQLAAENERDAAGDAHADWCLTLAEESQSAWILPDGARTLLRLEDEHGNLRAALAWLDGLADCPRLLRLTVALSGFWYGHSHYREGCAWLERALACGPAATPRARGRALVGLVRLLSFQGDLERAERLNAEGISLLRDDGDAISLSLALVREGGIANHRGTYDRAERLLEEAFVQATAVPDPVLAASLTGMALANLGVAAHGRGDLALATARHERSLATFRAQGNDLGVVRALRDLGDVARDQGDYTGSVAFYRECLALMGERGDLRVVVDALEGAALAAAAWRQPERAARLLGAAANLRERFGATFVVATDLAAHERALAVVRATLGERGLQAALSIGRGLPLATVTAEVSVMTPPETAAGGVDRAAVRLSAREDEVLRLLVAGKPDREIAETLFLSVRTVERHVARIFAKLGVRTRSAASGAAIASGLVEPDTPTTN